MDTASEIRSMLVFPCAVLRAEVLGARAKSTTFLENEVVKIHILQPCDADACPSQAS